jgi:beta-lactamase superfamily II metal-dependent hydrolase
MNKIEITMFQAGCGDSFLITIKGERRINILVDCGSIQTYYDFIKPKLLCMKEQGQAIDFLILTHMHADHLAGALVLFKENVDHVTSKIIRIQNILYNGFRGLDLCGYKDAVGDEFDKVIYKGIIAEGLAKISSVSGDISKKQDLLLSSYLLRGRYQWNIFDQFDSGIITADNLPSLNLGNNSYITFISPNTQKLNLLNKEWERYLKTIRRKISLITDDLAHRAYEAYMLLISNSESEKMIKKISHSKLFSKEDILKLSEKYLEEDTNVGNGSSIAFLLCCDDKNLLFLGDAHPEVYYQNLSRLREQGMATCFDVIKLSHHGSSMNISDNFLKTFDSKVFLISANGKNGHPKLNLPSNKKIIYALSDGVETIILDTDQCSITKMGGME